ncbi:UNVERIFIED_CONTAM: aminotransferase [Streptococcus canis]|uniref:Aminotransferase n=2 Tax=Streptococcus canis TaxID=1329 RepID=A0AAE4Q6B7_STRCB|nr:aminotransferase [Streptococcus canis]EIQ81643.1 transaminase [Streptococcus canis FSL Z3-227]MDV5976882.1 aminotransferase [Streptococcus canis]MDV5987876.1 aminotransferase [Streptococcus canis]MDV5994193.1 aminotransferase [Streptococcus canis]MDV6000763.1 aminotransferase [Streptococcus canis]
MKLPAFGVEEWLNQHEKEAIYDIAGSTIASLTLEELFEVTGEDSQAFYQNLHQKPLNYGWIEGSPDFKKGVANLYQNLEPENILQTNGATGANFAVLYALIEAGDHVIAHYPSYQQLYDIPESLGATVDYWQVKEDLNWLPDLDVLEQLIRPNTKLITINNANNPTGAYMNRDYLDTLIAIAKAHDLYIVSDEVYHSFASDHLLGIADLYDKGISVNSMSKTFSLPGIRVGWLAASEEIVELLRTYRDYTMICAGVFDDMVAALALKHAPKLLQRNRQILTRNLNLLDNWVQQEEKVSYVKPKQVSTAFVKLAIEEAIEPFALRLLRDYGTLVVPGNRFDRDKHVRIGYCCQPEILQAGLSALSEMLKNIQ